MPNSRAVSDNAQCARLEWPAPAKINRFLRVTGKRADGFHQIETLFQFLEFGDVLRFDTLNETHIRRIDAHDFELPETDLSIRAARLLQTTFPQAAARGVTITLHKTIPPGSGLGGGSSNAATTLLALNHLWQLGATRNRLAELGLQLGADVPLFVHGQAARAGGVGEVLEPVESSDSAVAERWLCVCLPPVAVSTARVFAEWQPHHSNSDSVKTNNDLEAITTRLYPEVGDALARLRQHGNAQMSGSGGAVYAEFNSQTEAAQVADKLNGVVTRTVNRHPLLDFRSRHSEQT